MPGTITQELVRVSDKQRNIVFTCIADAAAATFPATDISAMYLDPVQGWVLFDVVAFPTPGGTAPTADSDITVTTKAYPTRSSTVSPAAPRDVLDGNGANLIHSTTEKSVGSSNLGEILSGNLTLNITNNSVNSADVTVIYKFVKP